MNKQFLSKRIPAFTLLEVTVSLLITAVVIAITYTVAHIVTVNYQHYKKKQDRIVTFNTLDQLLKKDFSRPGKMIRTDTGLQIETTDGLISYAFEDKYVLRNQYALQTDTFHLPVRRVDCAFEKEESVSGQNMDRLELQITLEAEDITLIYQKTYSAHELIN